MTMDALAEADVVASQNQGMQRIAQQHPGAVRMTFQKRLVQRSHHEEVPVESIHLTEDDRPGRRRRRALNLHQSTSEPAVENTTMSRQKRRSVRNGRREADRIGPDAEVSSVKRSQVHPSAMNARSS